MAQQPMLAPLDGEESWRDAQSEAQNCNDNIREGFPIGRKNLV